MIICGEYYILEALLLLWYQSLSMSWAWQTFDHENSYLCVSFFHGLITVFLSCLCIYMSSKLEQVLLILADLTVPRMPELVIIAHN